MNDMDTQPIDTLLPVNNTEGINTVNARDLHAFLGSKQDFSTWIKKRIKDYGFEKNKDFLSLHKKMERDIGATSRIEYHISLDMAKELAMVERNEKGREARKYFIECEKRLRETLKPMTPLEMISIMSAEMVKMQAQSEEHSKRLDHVENVLLEKADLYDRLADSALLLSSTQMGNIFGISARAFNNKLKEYKVAYKTSYLDEKGINREHFVFYSDYKDNGLGKTVLWNRKGGAFGTCLKFYPSSVPFFERVFGIKANRQVLEALLLNKNTLE